MINCLADIEVILLGLNGQFWAQKEEFKTILGPILDFFVVFTIG